MVAMGRWTGYATATAFAALATAGCGAGGQTATPGTPPGTIDGRVKAETLDPEAFRSHQPPLASPQVTPRGTPEDLCAGRRGLTVTRRSPTPRWACAR